MNIVFWFLIILGLIAIWFTAGPILFNKLGSFLTNIYKEAIQEIYKKEEGSSRNDR